MISSDERNKGRYSFHQLIKYGFLEEEVIENGDWHDDSGGIKGANILARGFLWCVQRFVHPERGGKKIKAKTI